MNGRSRGDTPEYRITARRPVSSLAAARTCAVTTAQAQAQRGNLLPGAQRSRTPAGSEALPALITPGLPPNLTQAYLLLLLCGVLEQPSRFARCMYS